MKPTFHGLNEISRVLDTGFNDFTWHGGIVTGLAKEDGGGKAVAILAIDSKRPGNGNVKQFIREMQTDYESVMFLSLMNPRFEQFLLRIGFARGVYDNDGDATDMMLWRCG